MFPIVVNLANFFTSLKQFWICNILYRYIQEFIERWSSRLTAKKKKSATAFLPLQINDVIKDILPTSTIRDRCGGGYEVFHILQYQ